MYIEVKIKTKVETADGQKDIAEIIMVKADDVRSAEEKVQSTHSAFDFEVCSVKQTKYQFLTGEGSSYYSVKALMSVLDEKTGAEKNQTVQFLVVEDSFDNAKKKADLCLADFMSYIETTEIKKTKICDYYE